MIEPSLSPSTIWRVFTIDQVAAACLGQIPLNALAVGVEIDGLHTRIRFVLADETARDLEDMESIVESFADHISPDSTVEYTFALGDRPQPTPASDDFAWVYIARSD